MKRIPKFALFGAVFSLLLISSMARADAGIPMLALAWPMLWILIVPVIILEASFARRILSMDWATSLRFSLAANLWSALFGVPLTWLVLTAIEFTGAYSLGRIVPSDSPWMFLFVPFVAPWIPPLDSDTLWPIFAAGAVLCIPFGLTSMWIESKYGIICLGTGRAEDVCRWSRRANGISYLALFITLASIAAAAWLNNL